MKRLRLGSAIIGFGAAGILALAAAVVWAADNKTESKTEDSVVRHAIETYTAAYNRGDAKALADHWREQGEMIEADGERIQGRAAIQKRFEAIFADQHGLKIEILKPSVRRISPDVIVEEGVARVTGQGMSPADSAYVAMHVLENGQWKLDNVREVEMPSPPSRREELQGLEGLIGQWIDRGKDSTIESEFAWERNFNFILHTFKLSAPEIDDLEGKEVIGWDPVEKQIRSWIFDTDGGFGEGVWKEKNGRWIVKRTMVLHDGRKASSVQVYHVTDANTYAVSSFARQVDGRKLPNLEEVKVSRKPAAQEKTPATPPKTTK